MEKVKRTVLVQSKYALAKAEHHIMKTMNPLFPSEKVIGMLGHTLQGLGASGRRRLRAPAPPGFEAVEY